MPLHTLPTREPIAPGQLLIGGAWRDAADGAAMTTSDPTTEAAITSVARAWPIGGMAPPAIFGCGDDAARGLLRHAGAPA